MKNHNFLRALRREPVDRTPVWMMRQAGRYLPEYRKIREQAGDFITLCKTPELACEVTLQPLARFDFDAAILFSDILTIPDAMGLGLVMEENVGPRFKRYITQDADVEALPTLAPFDDLPYVMDAVSLIKKELKTNVPLIGFAGSPWTLACYMLGYHGGKNFHPAKKWIYQNPQGLRALLDKLIIAVTDYLAAQIEAGVDAIQIFDSWGGVLSNEAYHAFSLIPMAVIVETLKARYPDVPIILFTKGGNTWLESIASTGADGVSVDWTVSLADAFSRIGDRVAIQGNLDPAVLLGSKETIQTEVKKLLAEVQGQSGYIFNLGHGITPDIEPDNVAVLVDTIRNVS